LSIDAGKENTNRSSLRELTEEADVTADLELFLRQGESTASSFAPHGARTGRVVDAAADHRART